MTPRNPPPPDPEDPRIAELEAKLKRAYRKIRKLRREVASLKGEAIAPRTTGKNRRSRRRNSELSWLGTFLFLILLMAGGFWIAFRFVKPYILSPQPTLETPAISPKPTVPPSPQPAATSELTYNVKTPPQLTYSKELQAIADGLVNLAISQKLPTDKLSIYLIDINRQTFAEYRSQIPRFPASVTKLFWMVAVYAQVEANRLPANTIDYDDTCKTDLCQLVKHSDNEAASHILDRLTRTTSTPQNENFEDWLERRYFINRFFRSAGYQNIDISQKNFPVADLKMEKPERWDLKMRGNPEQPIRNQISAEQAGRLMYEIATKRAVSETASDRMLDLLGRDLNPKVWRRDENNPIAGFFGEGLVDSGVIFASKVGWTSESRQEVAYLRSPDGEIAYILVVFGDDPAYSKNWTIFPRISRFFFDRVKVR